jgi:signal transduction histidine kinase
VRALSARLELAREEEGARIARELHDELGSVLSMMKWELELLEDMLIHAEAIGQFSNARHKLTMLKKSAEAAISSVRRISSELRPGILDDLGLIAAVEWQAEQFKCGPVFYVRLSVLRKHSAYSQPRNIRLSDCARGAYECATTLVSDTGGYQHRTPGRACCPEHHGQREGVTPEEKRAQHSLGLAGMQERAHIAGGEMSIIGQAGKGTTVTVRVPVRNVL